MKPMYVRTRNVAASKKVTEPPTWLTVFQVLVGDVVSAATVFISWQTFELSQQTQETTAKLKGIEQQLAESKFGFERVRDIYDRAEKYLSSTTQEESRGRVLVVLINSLPDNLLRSELLAVVTERATSRTVAAAAASVSTTGRTSVSGKWGAFSASASASSSTSQNRAGFSGNLAIAVNEEKYTATTIGDFQFVDKAGDVWKVPKGTVSSGAGIPRMAWSMVGPPLTSDYTIPTILLDYYIVQRKRPPQQVYQMFLEALLATGMSAEKARTLHQVVVSFGPRWNVES